MIMITHKKMWPNWNILVKVDKSYINDLHVTNKYNDMEYDDQSHHLVMSLTPIAPYNDECQWKFIFGIKV